MCGNNNNNNNKQYNGGLLPDIILLTQCYYHPGNPFKCHEKVNLLGFVFAASL